MSARVESLLSGKRFPGRDTLRIQEVANVFGVDAQHVVNWTDNDELGYINVAGDPKAAKKTFRRIPVSEYDAFVIRRFSSRNGKAAA